ncbi:MAG: hypothetical protein IPM91_17030 [Bacteroidetes bacterium]|nr:hypothetical protein [Bacteroidota bacterium]
MRWFLYSILGMGLPFIIVDLLPEGMMVHKIATGISMGALTTGAMQHLLLKNHTSMLYYGFHSVLWDGRWEYSLSSPLIIQWH